MLASDLVLNMPSTITSTGHAQKNAVLSSQADTSALSLFPYCRCDDYRCVSSPYKLSLTQQQVTGYDTFMMCFKLVYIGCTVTTPCCSVLTNDVGKVEFSTGGWLVF